MKYLITLSLLFSAATFALENEGYYSDKWCQENNGLYKRSDVRITDEYGDTYPDCIIEGIAVEADWAYKFYEGIGQSFHYARATGKEPGVLLLLKEPEDIKYLRRLQEVQKWLQAGAAKVPFHVYYIETWK